MLSIFSNFVYIHDKKLNKNKLGYIDNIFLVIILQKAVCFYLIQFFKSFNLKYKKCKFQDKAICSAGIRFLAYNVKSPRLITDNSLHESH